MACKATQRASDIVSDRGLLGNDEFFAQGRCTDRKVEKTACALNAENGGINKLNDPKKDKTKPGMISATRTVKQEWWCFSVNLPHLTIRNQFIQYQGVNFTASCP